jgi:hypothetical protein
MHRSLRESPGHQLLLVAITLAIALPLPPAVGQVSLTERKRAEDFDAARERMVRDDIAGGGVT